MVLLTGALALAAQGISSAGQAPVELSDLLDRAAAYVAGYVTALTSVVSEERYEQVVQQTGIARQFGPGGATRTNTRVLVSDYLLVHVPGATEWLPFRDVYSVDGVPVRDRSDRLLKLFVEPHADAFQQALRIRDESSRYNLGNVTRDINVPTFALQFLTASARGRFAFTLKGRERIDDADTVIVEYEETRVPTLIEGRDHESVPVRGWFWIEPTTGRVMRTLIETRPSLMTTRIEVAFQYEPKLDLWVPSRMDERHHLDSESVEGTATYSRFRRFQVETSVQIK
jgi:hypothetical protein